MGKRIIALLLCLGMMLGLVASCGNEGSIPTNSEFGSGVDSENADDTTGAAMEPSVKPPEMTRGEWIVVLGNALGLNEYVGETAYFGDVTADMEVYPYVQSSYEWGILQFEDSDTFRAEDLATKAFVAETAILASGIIDPESAPDIEELHATAKEAGVVAVLESWDESLYSAEGQAAAAIARHLYMAAEEDEIYHSVITEGVVDLTLIGAGQVSLNSDYTLVTMPATLSTDLEEGTIFIAPGTELDPTGVARKVVSISIDGDVATVITEEPDLGEVFDELEVYSTVAPDADDLILEEGVTIAEATPSHLVANGTNIIIDDLVSRTGDMYIAEKTSGLEKIVLEVNFTKGTVSVAPEWENQKVTMERLLPPELRSEDVGASPTDPLGEIFEKTNYTSNIPITKDGIVKTDKNGWERHLTVTNKYSAGYEIVGSLVINEISAETCLKFRKVFGIPTSIERAVVEVTSDIDVNLNFKGTFEDELKIATMPLPIGATGITVELSFILFFNASGELDVRVEVDNTTRYEYSGGKSKKSEESDLNTAIELALKMEAGPGFTVMVKALGIKVVDAKVTAAVSASSSATLSCSVEHETPEEIEPGATETTEKRTYILSLGLETTVSAPVIKLKIGSAGTLANKLKITYSATLLSAEKAPLQWKPSFGNKNWELLRYEVVDTIPVENVIDQETESREGLEENNPYATLEVERMVFYLEPEGMDVIQITSFPNGESLSDVTFSSTNTAVAIVDQNGNIIAIGEGTAQIRITTPKGGFQVCVVTVSGGKTFSPEDFL